MKNTILCPTRGGQESYPNQDRAITLAKERDANLIFMYVSDIQFLDHTAAPKVVDIEKELDEMGDFLVAMAIERARKSDVEATSLVKRGAFGQALVETIEDLNINTVILGQSRVESSTLAPGYILQLAKQVSRETGVEIIIVHDGEITDTILEQVR